jgi:hypothetical protein
MPPSPSRRRPSASAKAGDPPEASSQPVEGSDAASSTGSSAATSPFGLIADAGPAFDPQTAAEGASERQGDRKIGIEPGGETGLQIEWHEETVKAVLEAKGSALHSLIGKAEQDWIYTKEELRAIGGPLTRILNRYDATRVAAGTGDELALILGLSGYTMRSYQERKAVLDAERAEEEQGQAPLGQTGVDQSLSQQIQPPIPDPPLQGGPAA